MMLNNDILVNATATAREAETDTAAAAEEAESKDVASVVSAAVQQDLRPTATMLSAAATATEAETIVNDVAADVSSVRRRSSMTVNEHPVVDGGGAVVDATEAVADANACAAKTTNALAEATTAAAIAANDNVEEGISVLQQLKAKKNKSNLFLIKSYSFIDKTNHNNNNGKNNTQQEKEAAAERLARMSCVSAPPCEWQNELQQQQQQLQGYDAAHHKKNNGLHNHTPQTPEFSPLIDIETLLLEQITTDHESDAKAKKKRQKQQQKQNKDNNKAKQKHKKTKDKTPASTANGADGNPPTRDLNTLDELEPEYQQLLRKPMTIHEYEELTTTASKQQPNSQKRPKSMPTKINLAVANNNGSATPAYAPKKPAGAGIKRESFIRQSLQSIRRSFSSHKKQQQQQGGGGGGVSTSSASSTISATGSRGSAGSVREAKANGIANTGPRSSSDNERVQSDTAAALRSTSSVNAISQAATPVHAVASTTSMAQVPQRVTIEKSATSLSLLNHHNQQLQQQREEKRPPHYCQQLSLPESLHSSGGDSSTTSTTRTTTTTTTDLTKSAKDTQQKNINKSLRHNNTGTLNPLVTVQSSSSIRSNASSSNSSGIGIGGNGSSTAKQHEQQMAAVAASTAASTATTSAAASSSNAVAVVAAAIVPEKEKKRKEVSSSRVKKFHRHFSQVSKDEKLINYFSCALVSDILLQGHLYITDQHFAFYSNVFGYVTKVVIPTSSVTKISKEKTAKIIPNAVGVATADERHVFGSFISRESAFRLMCSVCPPLAPAELLPKTTADIEISEEYSIEDDSSCSISGNESPPQLLDAAAKAAGAGDGQTLIRRHVVNASSKSAGEISRLPRHSDLPCNAKSASNGTTNSGVGSHASVSMRTSAPPGVHYDTLGDLGPIPTPDFATVAPNSFGLIIAGSISTSTTPNGSGSSTGPSTSSSPTTVVGSAVTASPPTTTPVAAAAASTDTLARTVLAHMRKILRACMQRWQDHSELHVLYLGIMLAVVLALFSVFLLYRILDIEAKTQLYNSPVDFNWRAGNEDEDIFAEALRWQRELQAKSAEEAQTILSKNLEQISKVRRSLETLSMLIHDRSHVQAASNHEDGD